MNTTTIKVYVDTRQKLKVLAALLGKSMQDTAATVVDNALKDAQEETAHSANRREIA